MADKTEVLEGTIEHVEESVITDEESANPEGKLIPLLPVYIHTVDEKIILRNIVDYNSLGHPKQLMKSLETFRQNGWFSDVAIVHGQEEILVHRLVLMAASKFFENVFQDICSNNKAASIDMSMMPKHVLYRLINYIYTGRIKFSSKDPNEFLECARILQLNYLIERYFKFLVRHASPNNFCKILELLHEYLPHNEDLKQHMEDVLDL